MASSLVESHPQKQAIIDALLSGESTRSIASRTDPPLSDTCIWRFKNTVIAPAISRSVHKIQQLRSASPLPQASEAVASVLQNPILQRKQALAEASHASIVAPFVARMERKYARYDELLSKATSTEEPDLKGIAALDACETRSMDLHARLVGAIAPEAAGAQQSLSLTLMLVRPGAGHEATHQSECIDMQAESLE